MAPSFDSLRLRNQRQIDSRLTTLHRRMAEQIALEIIRFASADGLIPADVRTREALRLAIWEKVIRPFYVGGTDALIGPEPQSPYARLLVEGITTATRIQAERQAALVRRVCKDDDVVAWLTGAPDPLAAAGLLTLPATAMPPTQWAGIAFNPTTGVLGGLRGPDGRIDVDRARAALVRPRGNYSAFHEWVDPRGYRLSDRIWNTSVEVRARVDQLLTYHVAAGTSAVDMAKLMETFLTPGGRVSKTKTPYGSEGSYSARRLCRTEVSSAAHRATAAASVANPFVGGIQWRLSASHPRMDICDDYARGGPNGDGIYPPEQIPALPHPHCLCSTLPVPVGSTDALVETLRADIAAARGSLIEAVGAGDPARGLRLQGLLNPERMTKALLDGTLDTTVAEAVKKSAQRLPAGVRAGAARAVAEPKPVYDLSGGKSIRERLVTEIEGMSTETINIQQEIDDITRQVDAIVSTNAQRGQSPEVRSNPDLRRQIVSEAISLSKPLQARRAELLNRIKELQQADRQSITLKFLELPKDQQSTISINTDAFRGASGVRQLRENADEAASFTNKITRGNQGTIVAESNKSGRASASNGSISIAVGDEMTTIIHEIGHALEMERGAESRAKRIAFFDDRTKDDNLRTLRSITGSPFYGDEMAKRDKWAHAYMGKVYQTDSDQRSASELISMGIERLYEDAYALAQRDPEYFDFVVSWLRGTL